MGNETSKARSIALKYSETIARSAYVHESAIIPADEYNEEDVDEIVRILLQVDVIENAVPDDDGIHVFTR